MLLVGRERMNYLRDLVKVRQSNGSVTNMGRQKSKVSRIEYSIF